MVSQNVVQKDELQLLSAADAAKMCRISRRSWFRLNSSGRVPSCVRVGGSPRWRRTDLESWISKNCPDRKSFEAMREVTK